jgi:hypothetical protein
MVLSRLAWRNKKANLREVKSDAQKSGVDVFKATYSFWLSIALNSNEIDLFDEAILTFYLNLPEPSLTKRKQRIVVPSGARYDKNNRVWSYDTTRLINEYELEMTRLPKNDIRSVESNVKVIRGRINDAANTYVTNLRNKAS